MCAACCEAKARTGEAMRSGVFSCVGILAVHVHIQYCTGMDVRLVMDNTIHTSGGLKLKLTKKWASRFYSKSLFYYRVLESSAYW
jgi:hypothetical protein